MADLKSVPPCTCCHSTKILGPYIGEIRHGGIVVRLFQCHGTMPDGRRCENTRNIKGSWKVTEGPVPRMRAVGAL